MSQSDDLYGRGMRRKRDASSMSEAWLTAIPRPPTSRRKIAGIFIAGVVLGFVIGAAFAPLIWSL